MFRIVTIAREYGSGGAAIAQNVAQRLGWRLLDSKLIEAIARSEQVTAETARRYDECVDSWWHRFNRGGLWSLAVMTGATPTNAEFFDAEYMAAVAQEVIEGAAAKGNCVIVGRGAQCVLQSWPDALHVFIYSPWAERVARVQKRARENGDLGDLLQSTDRMRAKYLRRHFGCDWKEPHLYHMMISSQLGEENAAELIVGAVACGELATFLQSSRA